MDRRDERRDILYRPSVEVKMQSFSSKLTIARTTKAQAAMFPEGGCIFPPFVFSPPKTFDPSSQRPVRSPSLHSKCRGKLQVQTGSVQPHAPELLSVENGRASAAARRKIANGAEGEMDNGEAAKESA